MEFLSPEKIEPIILKLFYTDAKYCTLLTEIYERQWFSDEEIGRCIELCGMFHSKFGKLPTFDTLKLFVEKYYENHANPKVVAALAETVAKLQASNNIKIDKYDSDWLEKEIVDYLQNSGIYWTIMSNVDTITQEQSVAHILNRLQFLSNMNFDVDLGFDYLENIQEHCEELQEDDARISTGWDNMDYVMNGGLLEDGRCLAVIMGQTHIGKSLVLSNMACNMLKNDKFVVIISLEMSEHIYGTRIGAHLSTIDINKLKHNADTLLNRITNLKDKHSNAKLIIKEFPPDSVNCAHLKTYLEKLIAHHGRKPDAIFIDYINLLVPNHQATDNSYNKYRTVATEMRSLSYIFNCPIISVTQMNRSGFGSTDPGLDDTSDSMGIPMVADFVGGLYQNEGDKDLGRLNCAVLKNRLGGQVGTRLEFSIDYNNLGINDIKTTHQAPESVVSDVMTQIGAIDGL